MGKKFSVHGLVRTAPPKSEVIEMKSMMGRWRRRRYSLRSLVGASAIFFTAIYLLVLALTNSLSSYSSTDSDLLNADVSAKETERVVVAEDSEKKTTKIRSSSECAEAVSTSRKCATVEQMGEIFGAGKGSWEQESLRVRNLIERHFDINGAARVRELPPDLFCSHGFVIGKASEAGFGNEMYKILSAAALSIMLNRSLIIGKTRGKYPFGDYITYSNLSFTLKEVKHLWKQNGCETKYGRHLVMRIDDFQKPGQTGVLCDNWRAWKQPVIWFQNVTDAVAVQFFLKNVHVQMRKVAFNLFGMPENLQSRPNVFGELMRVLISPSENIKVAVDWALKGGTDPDIALHMRMLTNRSLRAMQSASACIRKVSNDLQLLSRPRVVVVSDTPSVVKEIAPKIEQFAELTHFDFKHFETNISSKLNGLHQLGFRAKDWGSAPRWVAFVDFFLASRAKQAIVSGAQRRVGTTYAQLIAALAASNRLEKNSSLAPAFSFFSSFQRNLIADGLKNQVGWGHVWNRFAGPLSCRRQAKQCASTPLLPPAWWDGLWQSPIPRDINRMRAYGIKLSSFGTFDEDDLRSFCKQRKKMAVKVPLI